MTIFLPTLFGYTMSNICEKVIFYNNICLSKIIVNDITKLMQSIKLGYARYKYY